jgi:predicted AlkP superfamily pyrophosphatase or phosphodiesterase
MARSVILLTVPGLRHQDVASMPKLRERMAGGAIADFVPGFPCVTCPVQANITTGVPPYEHGVVANGFYWRERRQVEMWTSPNDCIERPQIWESLSRRGLTSAVWFPLHSRGCKADYVCTPAPVHNPDGSESLWCYTRPTELYGRLRDRLGHFPLMHFWGPMAGLPSSRWIAESAVFAAREYQPDFFYIYIPQLDYAAQRTGPDSPAAIAAVAELDDLLDALFEGMHEVCGDKLLWLIAGEYVISPVDHVCYPNRLLREAGLLAVRNEDDGEHLDLTASTAWAMVDHQMSHVFVAGGGPQVAVRVADLFSGMEGIAEVLVGDSRARYRLDHPRSGEVILVSTPNSWQAYYWWQSDACAPSFARTVDIHRKPGYDPVELCFDPATKSIPLDATRIKGSHGAPADDPARQPVLLSSEPLALPSTCVHDTDLFGIVMRQFGT